MAIVKMSKFHLFTFNEQRQELLKALQKFNLTNFNDLKVAEGEDGIKKVELPEEIIAIDERIQESKWAIDLLSKYQKKEGLIEGLTKEQKSFTLEDLRLRANKYDFEKNYKDLKDIYESRARYEQKIQNDKTLIDELKPWSSIPIEVKELKNLKSVGVSIGTIPEKFLNELKEDLSKFELAELVEVDRLNKLSYGLIFYDKSIEDQVIECLRKNSFAPSDIKTDGYVKDKIKELEENISSYRSQIEKLDKSIEKHCVDLEDFQIVYDFNKNEKLRLSAENNFISTDRVNVMEGYLPTDKVDDFIKTIEGVVGSNYYFDVKEADRDDKDVPIILKNNKFVSDFQMLTSMYSMPKYNEIDPTPLFAPFYWLFSGIMIGDAGYGLIVLIACLIGLKFFNLKKSMRSMVRFFMYLAISTTIWGLVFGSFFGDTIKLPALIDPATESVKMIGMSLIFGTIHIFFALGIKAYMNIRDRNFIDFICDVLVWYLALIGIILWIISVALSLSPILNKIGMWLTIIGLIGIAATGGRAEKSLGGKIGWGIYSAYGITSYIGDFVSYLRLMALCLAGSFIAVAVNMIVRILIGAGPLGVVFAVIIFLVFQLFNAFLSYLSAYVHSARLVYVEMFNKFYEGGGRPFKNMIEESKYFNIKEE
ncbi:V/A-type H+-transporting ATPase subunit I [Peptoniphilus koenoeneniae]|uniref:V/A-type H+-transporting ATPase subunit I n=1 Tax=Peptoniphilus koenoeneniae TaxID=507751 RepID=A0ABU0AW61_9FIRM|nr:V-type ATP synthase subunit I [Peptoniphilus koenoeneniae]MDQ0275499.1 V/A-type H+-transporting ATPase subunit I [Peptoniphilus koenoeneniae]